MRPDVDRAAEIQRGFRVRGAVQGVGFRWWTRRLAQDLGVQGTVRNCPDGTVEVHARGSGDALDAFARALAEGPPMAVVHGVEAFASQEVLPRAFEIVQWR